MSNGLIGPDGKEYWQDANGRYTKQRDIENNRFTLASAPTAQEYGVGQLWIDGQQYWSDGRNIVASDSSNKANKVVVLGDSYDVRSEGTADGFGPHGIWRLTNELLENKIDFVHFDAVNGSGAIAVGAGQNYQSRIDNVLSYDCDYVAVRCSVNDLHNESYTLQQLIDAYSAIFSKINNAGRKIITNTVSITGTILASQIRLTNFNLFNEWLFNNFEKNWNGILLDQSWQLRDNTLAGGINTTYAEADLTHPTLAGGIRFAVPAAEKLKNEFNNLSIVDIYSQPYSGQVLQLDKNPLNLGTAGTKYNGVTGIVPDNKALSIQNTGTAVASKVTRDDGAGEWLQVDWQAGAAQKLIQYFNNPPTTPLPAGIVSEGDVLSAFCEYEIDASSPAADAHYPTLHFDFRDNANNVLAKTDANTVNSAFASMGRPGVRMVLETKPITVPQGATKYYLWYGFYTKTGGQMIVRFGRSGVRKHV